MEVTRRYLPWGQGPESVCPIFDTIGIGIVQKTSQALPFLAIMKNDPPSMNTLATILILALLAISGAAYTDVLLTSDQQAAQRAN